MNTEPIFIHSLFRTGSTYLWNKFRQDGRFHCYYEPFHQIFPLIHHGNVADALTPDFQKVKHPELKKPYLQEYEPLLEAGKQGIPFFKESFCFAEFCNNKKNPALLRYINYLLKGAGEKTPVLQFNRSALRIRWFKENYPESRNIYLLRNPRDQWQSYVEIQSRLGDDVFLVMDLLCVGKNASEECFKGLAATLPLMEFHGAHLTEEFDFYRRLLADYSMEERYFIFYYIWFRSFMENALYADTIININQLSDDTDYRAGVCARLNELGIPVRDFDDARIHRYSAYQLTGETMTSIEHRVRRAVLSTLPDEIVHTAFKRITEPDRRYFQLDADDPVDETPSAITAEDINEKSIQKFKQVIVRQIMENICLDRENKCKDDELERLRLHLANPDERIKYLMAQGEAQQERIQQLNHQLTSIKNSRSWRYMAPFRFIQRLLVKKQ